MANASIRFSLIISACGNSLIKLRYREDILDNMGSEELVDNIFRIAQTDAKLKRDNIDNEYTADSIHYEVGKAIRESIKN